MNDEEFLDTFNEWYPFERYVVKNPQAINYLFDDVLLTEIFVPKIELKHDSLDLVDEASEDIYVKLKLKDSDKEFRMAFFDFDVSVRDTMVGIILEEFDLNWESLYIDYEDESDYDELKDFLLEQKQIQIEKYGECNIKDNYKITAVLDLLK